MKRFLLPALCLLSSVLLAQEPPRPSGVPDGVQVDQAEIARWGDRVVVSGEGPRDAGDVLFSMAMAPPPDDSGLWFVTVWGSSSDAASLGVVKAFQNDANLAPFVAVPPGQKLAWAHFNFYRADDVTQRFRFEQFAIPLEGPFPIVTITPPRDGSFGGVVKGPDGKVRSVVVDRIEASALSQPAELKNRIIGSVKLWCQKLAEGGFVPPAKVAERFYEASPIDDTPSDRRLVHSGSHGQVPFAPPAPMPNIAPQFPQFPPGGPAADPTVKPAEPAAPSTFNLPTILQGLLALLLGSDIAMRLLPPLVTRWQEKAKTTTSVIDDLVSGFVRAALEQRLKVPPKDGSQS